MLRHLAIHRTGERFMDRKRGPGPSPQVAVFIGSGRFLWKLGSNPGRNAIISGNLVEVGDGMKCCSETRGIGHRPPGNISCYPLEPAGPLLSGTPTHVSSRGGCIGVGHRFGQSGQDFQENCRMVSACLFTGPPKPIGHWFTTRAAILGLVLGRSSAKLGRHYSVRKQKGLDVWYEVNPEVARQQMVSTNQNLP